MLLEVSYRRIPRCVYCSGKKLCKKASYIRQVKHETIGHRLTLLRFKAHKFYCYDCKRYFNQQFEEIEKHQRATERLHYQVFHRHTQGKSQQDLSKDFKMGKATIERWYHKRYRLEHQELQTKHCPQVLGIDEHFFSKKQGYATTLCKLSNHNI